MNLTLWIHRQTALTAVALAFLISCEAQPPYGKVVSLDPGITLVDLTPLSDGSFLFAGIYHGDEDFQVLAYFAQSDSSFQLKWEKRYRDNDIEMGTHLLRLEDRYLLIGASSSLDSARTKSRVVLLDNDYREVFHHTFGQSRMDRLSSGALSPGGGVILVGSTRRDKGQGINGWLVQLDDSGSLVWEKTFGVPGIGKGDWLSDIAPVGRDRYLISGLTFSSGNGQSDGWLQMVDLDGELLWSQTCGGPGKDSFADMLILQNGHVLLGGVSTDTGGTPMGWLLEVDQEGELIRSHYYPQVSRVSELCRHPEAGYVLAGIVRQAETETDVWLAHISESGEILWEQTIGSKRLDNPGGLVNLQDRIRLTLITNSFEDQGNVWVIDVGADGQLF